jgi:cytochrome c oxidase subunit III
MLYALSFIFLFTIGGLTGLFLGTLSTDVHLHDTYFVVAHFHYVMMGGVLIAFLGGIFTTGGRRCSAGCTTSSGARSGGLVFVGFNLTFFPQFVMGSQGMPRRYYNYAYAIWRTNHPEIFLYAQNYLSTFWGAFNTVVLLFSSLTAAWAVRCAQLGQKNGLILCLVLTILCAFGFMGVKFVEYKDKFDKGLGWGRAYAPVDPYIVDVDQRGRFVPMGYASKVAGELGMPLDTPEQKAASIAEVIELYPNEPAGVRQFFSIYFAMTGLHGIHVVGGIIVLLWLLVRAIRGEFGPKYFGPIDYAALYWHIVDLVWIYLFPMLYLIH